MATPIASPEQEIAARRWRRALIVLACLPPLALAATELYLFDDLLGFPLDDPWIHLQFARNLHLGEGLAYDAGRRVAGSTAPLWTALLSVLFLLPGPVEVWTKLLGVACHAASVAVTFDLGRRLGLSLRRSALAAGLVVLCEFLLWSSLSGMEIPLFVLLSLAGVAAHLDERRDDSRPPKSFLIFGLAALARPEGLLLPLLAAVDRVLAARTDGGGLELSRQRLARVTQGLALAAIVVVPVGIAYLVMSGSPLPTTLGAKASGPPRWYPELRDLIGVFDFAVRSSPLTALLATGGAVTLLSRLGGPRDRGLLLPAWAFGMPVAASMLSSGNEFLVGNFGRYFFPLLPAFVLLGILALDAVPFARLRALSIGRLRLPLAVPLVLALLLAPAARRAVWGGGIYLQSRANVEDSDVAAARWLAGNVPPDALLGLCDIGVVKYRLPNPIVDLAGIASPERKAWFRRMEREHGLPWPAALRLWLEQVRPEVIVIYPSWFSLLEREPDKFPVLRRFRIPNNVAMGGDELVVYATPWSRPGIVAPPAPPAP